MNTNQYQFTLKDIENMLAPKFEVIDKRFLSLEKSLKNYIDVKIDSSIDEIALMIGKGFNEMGEQFDEVRSDIKGLGKCL